MLPAAAFVNCVCVCVCVSVCVYIYIYIYIYHENLGNNLGSKVLIFIHDGGASAHKMFETPVLDDFRPKQREITNVRFR